MVDYRKKIKIYGYKIDNVGYLRVNYRNWEWKNEDLII
jgi:hypothetical protein